MNKRKLLLLTLTLFILIFSIELTMSMGANPSSKIDRCNPPPFAGGSEDTGDFPWEFHDPLGCSCTTDATKVDSVSIKKIVASRFGAYSNSGRSAYYCYIGPAGFGEEITSGSCDFTEGVFGIEGEDNSDGCTVGVGKRVMCTDDLEQDI